MRSTPLAKPCTSEKHEHVNEAVERYMRRVVETVYHLLSFIDIRLMLISEVMSLLLLITYDV